MQASPAQSAADSQGDPIGAVPSPMHSSVHVSIIGGSHSSPRSTSMFPQTGARKQTARPSGISTHSYSARHSALPIGLHASRQIPYGFIGSTLKHSASSPKARQDIGSSRSQSTSVQYPPGTPSIAERQPSPRQSAGLVHASPTRASPVPTHM